MNRRNSILLSGLLLFCFAFTFSCANEQTAEIDTTMENQGTPPLNSRASQARAITVENIFIKLPEEAFQAEGWDNISTKERRHLLSKGNLDAFEANVNENQIIIKEQFQNEDDQNERAAVVEMMVFRHAEEDYNIVYMGQKYVHENERKSDEPISANFWRFDGRHWHEISEDVPQISTADFFEENFDLSKVEADHIIISPNQEYDNALSASLAYDLYEEYGLGQDQLVTKERYFVNLIWNGQMFEKQRKPTVLE
jgi:hypothetical protein